MLNILNFRLKNTAKKKKKQNQTTKMQILMKLNYVTQKIFQPEIIRNYQDYEIWNFGKQVKLHEVKPK